VLLVIVTLIPYSRLAKCGFVNYDDPIYVTQNPHVQQLSVKNLLWAFNVGYNSNWHPLTWISHMVDYRIWGTNALGHHATNLLLHLASIILLFLILMRTTRSVWQSFFVAALFAIHPLHVESVAWIAEHKDVLSTVFWMLTMGAYVLYAERPGWKRYSAVVLLYALGLMAKPMLVSLPLVLLMLDYWPSRRLKSAGLTRLVIEKSPMLILAAASSVITMIAQHRGHAASSLAACSVGMRVSNALVSYLSYIVKMVWPKDLAVFYPHPRDTISAWLIVLSALVLVGISLIAIRERRSRPYLLVGWLWYVITLIPVIGLVQVGSQAMADRYTYVPLIGVFIMLAWGIGEKGRKGKRKILGAVASLAIVALAVQTWLQVGYWRNSIVLFEHALAVSPENNYPAHSNLGRAYADKGDYAPAVAEYEKALAMRQDEAHVRCDYGDSLAKLGRIEEAVEQYQEALAVDPKLSQAQDRLTAIRQSRVEAALAQRLQKRAKPNSAPAHVNNGVILQSRGQREEAIKEYKEAIRIDANLVAAHNNLAVLYDNLGRTEEAISEFKIAIRLKPDNAAIHGNYAVALYMNENYEQSLREVQLCREYGGTPNPKLVQALSGKFPGVHL